MKKITQTQKIKNKARRTLSSDVLKTRRNFVIDTSAIINKFLPKLIAKGLQGKITIPHASIAELENLANKGKKEGFIGLEEIANLHKLKKKHKISIYFQGLRPSEKQIKFAKSGDIDALILEIARNSKAVLVTADLVQAKSAQAYNLQVIFLRTKIKHEKKKSRFLFWKR